MGDFSDRLIVWHKQHGRHNLPWQNTQDTYAIWVSEIMLQQTQVAAVIHYYRRFMQRFPDIRSLANSSQDEVLKYWSGLGYYSRARNLHEAAQKIVDEHAGCFPQLFDSIINLPGIGRSTAAAISTFAFQQPRAILDGNVKRVFARHFAIEGWPGDPKVERRMWALAEQLLPQSQTDVYIQAQMDLGAIVCSRSRPRCDKCPLQETCQALAENRVKDFPQSKPRKAQPSKETAMLILMRDNEVMLEKRLPVGIWGGLWSLPEMAIGDSPGHIAKQRFGIEAELGEFLGLFSHGFTHFRLNIQPILMRVRKIDPQVSEAGFVWLDMDEAIGAALPSPVRKILLSLNKKAA